MLHQPSADTSAVPDEGLAFDEIVERALVLCNDLPATVQYGRYRQQIAGLSERLAGGRLHLAILGQFNRGKSTFLNALLGMPVLPVSVLPITSVPTVIVGGPRITCTVEFADGRDPVRAAEPLEHITGVLQQYVAEANNPQNEQAVSRVTVTCDSGILKHGTVLIDTPGFGSTHVHNTETTRRLLEKCDAALFLLSADLPITQTEVEFLFDVRTYVPRIFFIYNKTDILSDQELRTTTEYIRSVLMRQLHFTRDLYLYPISARTGEQAAQHDPGDENWVKSGMACIETEIVDFMLREKYFTLANAVNDKCKTALDGIVNLLHEENTRRTAPLELLKGDLGRVRQYTMQIQRDIRAALQRAGQEEKLLRSQFEELLAAHRDKTVREIESTIDTLATEAAWRAGSRRSVCLSAARSIDDILGRLYVRLASELNRTLRKRAAVHQKALEKLARNIAEDLSLEYPLMSEDAWATADVEVDTAAGWKPTVLREETPESWTQNVWDRVRTRAGRRSYYTRSLSPHLKEYTDLCIQELLNTGKNRIQSAQAQLCELLAFHYQQLQTHLQNWQEEKKGLLDREAARVRPQVEATDSLHARFSEIRRSLV